MTKNAHIVRFGRTDQTAIKTNFLPSKKLALQVANNVSFLIWGTHAFKASECQASVRIEAEGFWMEFHPQDLGTTT